MYDGAKKRKKPRSLTFILWLSFFLFSAIVITIYGFGETALLRQVYRQNTVRTVEEAADDIRHGMAVADENYGGFLTGISEKYAVTVRVYAEDGEILYPRVISEEEDSERASIEEIKERGDRVFPVDSDAFACVCRVRISGENAYVYVTQTVVLSGGLYSSVILQMVYIGVLLVLVASLLSWAISSYVAKPISDLTEKAQKMKYGSLSVDFTSWKKGRLGYKEIDELSQTLNHAESELSKADKMQQEVIANVSHDFKTPLTMIKAYASMIQEISGDDPARRNKHAQIIADEADRLAALVGDVLDLSKISAGLVSLKYSLFNLSAYLKEIASRFEYLAETQGYHFVSEIADELYVEADKEKIGQVLYNLIGNAVSYTGEDKTVYIRLYGENGLQHFTVTDTGAGIPPEEIAVIWERYYRSSETHKRPVKGTGLGLSIVKAVLTKHDFHFGVRSEVGKGSTFFVDFPAKTATEIRE